MLKRVNSIQRSFIFTDLGLLEYKRALDLQLQTLVSKIENPLLEDHVYFVEHPCVFTLGKRGGQENLGVSKKFLHSKGIDVVQTDRGGNITYHGPGQAVLYPIIDLEKNKISVKDFVHGLEEIMKQTTQDFSIDAHRNKKNHGIWVGDSKIGSVGISIKKGISFHGLALNIFPDLEPFSWINPCGLADVSMTSIKKEMTKKTKSFTSDNDVSADNLSNKTLSMDKIKEAFLNHFTSVFNFSMSESKKRRWRQ